MKFTITRADNSPWTEIHTEKVDFDGCPPVPRFRFAWPVGEPSADRTAVGLSLIFAPWIAGRCDFPKPISALTAQRISEWFQLGNIWTSPSPVRAGGLPLPRGYHRLQIGDELSTVNATHGATRTLVMVTSDHGSGESLNTVRLASNLDVLSGSVESETARHLMRLGAAVLVAESLGVNEYIDGALWNSDQTAFGDAKRLLECTGLGLAIE